MEPASLRVLVAEDERPARRKLRRLLEARPEVGTVHEAGDGRLALEAIREAQPDVVFLDVAMPGLSGMGVVEALGPEAIPCLVFVTAHPDYAVRAFDVEAVDYLLKPFDDDRFERTWRRVLEEVERGRTRESVLEGAREVLEQARREVRARVDRLVVEGPGGGKVLLRVDAIERAEAARNHVLLQAGGRVHRLRGTLTELEARLDPAMFVRVNRSTLVPLDGIVEIRPLDHGDAELLMRDGGRVRLSRRYRDRLDRFRR